MRLHIKSLLFSAAAMLLLSGCLSSPNAFYTSADIVQDDRIIGDYTQSGAAAAFTIHEFPRQPGRYLLHVYDRSEWVDFMLTLFRIGDSTYADATPVTDSDEVRIGTARGPAQSLKQLAFQPLHLVTRIALSDDGLAWSVPKRGDLKALATRKLAAERPFAGGASVVLSASTADLHKLLEEEGDSIFPKPTEFRKPKPFPK